MKENLFTALMTDMPLRSRFIAEPDKILSEFDLPGFQGKNLIVHENSSSTMNFTLLPKGSEFNEEMIDSRLLKIQKMAWEDSDFAERLMRDTHATLTEFFGAIPESITINIFMNSPDTQHIVLPAVPQENSDLSDSDLELVAGGKGSVKNLLEYVGGRAGDLADSLVTSIGGRGSATDLDTWIGIYERDLHQGKADLETFKHLFSGW